MNISSTSNSSSSESGSLLFRSPTRMIRLDFTSLNQKLGTIIIFLIEILIIIYKLGAVVNNTSVVRPLIQILIIISVAHSSTLNSLIKTMGCTQNPEPTEDDTSTVLGIYFSGFCSIDDFSDRHLPRKHPIISI